jgi:AcrR family transcriptional regulator
MDHNAAMTGSQPTGRKLRLNADDWIDAADAAMVEGGIAAVAVEPLAERLGVTKGSFYWHFPNRDALLAAMLERWARDETEAAIADLDRIVDPRERLEQLIVRALADDEAARFGHAFHLAVSDAADDPIVRPVLQRVSERRIDYLIACFRALGLSADEARQRGLLAYAAYVGTLRLAKESPGHLPAGGAGAAYRRHLVMTLMPPLGD